MVGVVGVVGAVGIVWVVTGVVVISSLVHCGFLTDALAAAGISPVVGAVALASRPPARIAAAQAMGMKRRRI